MIDEVKSSFEKASLNPKHLNPLGINWTYIQLPGIVGGSESKAIKYSMNYWLSDGYLSRGHIDEYFKRYKAAELQYKKNNTDWI
jgi:hypothetical protein